MSVESFAHFPEQPIVSALNILPGGAKWLDTIPRQVRVGAVQLLGWDIHAVDAPSEYADSDFYVIRLGHEVAMEHRTVRPAWVEVGIGFSADGSESEATVVDALPRTVLTRLPAESYALNKSMMLVPSAGVHTLAFLPDVAPTVDVFGLSSPEVRWRYTETKKGPLQLGTQTCWVVLAVPKETTSVTVTVTGAFELRATADRPQTGSTPVAFCLPLRRDLTVKPDDSLARTELDPAPRVFISYAHDDEDHKELVKDFSNFLCGLGIDSRVDAYFNLGRIDWDDEWATQELKRADFIAVVASPRMRIVGDGEALPGENLGLRSEFGKIRNLLQGHPEQWVPKILPVILPGGSIDDLPLSMNPWTKTHYRINSLTVEGADDFLRTVTGQFRDIRPVIAPKVVLLPG